MSLCAGQIVRYSAGLWRVDYVNECRAHIIPLAKRHVVLVDDEGQEKRVFDSEQRGVNISPDSPLEVVIDLARAKDEIELANAEREEREWRAALAAAEKAEAKATPAPRPALAQAEEAPAGRIPQGWRLGSTPAPAHDSASLKAAVLAWVGAHPGETTKQVAAGCAPHSAGAVAACLDRFRKIGVVTK